MSTQGINERLVTVHYYYCYYEEEWAEHQEKWIYLTSVCLVIMQFQFNVIQFFTSEMYVCRVSTVFCI